MVRKDSKHIETLLRNNYKGIWRINNLQGCIGAGLSTLWANEEIQDVFFYTMDDFRYLLFVTDKARAVQVTIESSSYSPSARAYDMTGADANKSRCIEKSTEGWFGKTYYYAVFEVQEKPLTIVCEDKNTASAILASVLQAARKAAAACAPKPTAPTAPKTPTAPAPSASSSLASAIVEIRKMYEDGLIDKAEMLDLIKSLK